MRSNFCKKTSLFFLLCGLFSIQTHADTIGPINFESPTYNLGVINSQDGWTSLGAAGSGCALYDHKVDSSLGTTSFGAQSLRISDAITSGCFGDQTFSKPLIDAVGESDSTSGGYTAGTLQRHFEMKFDLASAVPGAEQVGLHISVSPDRGDGSRMSYLRFEDSASGILVYFDDVQGTTNPANFVETLIATLNRAVPHTIRLTMDIADGPSNDIVKVYVDGALKHTGTSWENYYRYDSESAAEQSPRITKAVIFRTGGEAVVGDLGNGFLFDNLSLMSSSDNPSGISDKCKNNGWKNFTNPSFRNQGLCVSFFNHLVTAWAEGNITMSDPSQQIKFTTWDAGANSTYDGGTVEYWNFDYPGPLHYTAPILCSSVKSDTKESWFMFQIPAGWPGLTGLYVVSYVKDGGTPGVSGDLYGHAGTTDLNTAKGWCENKNAPVSMYTVSGGNLVIH